MSYPKETSLENKLELKLGIKSSLPNPKKMLGLLCLIWCTEKKSEIHYSVAVKNKIEFKPDILDKAIKKYKDKFEKLNLSPEDIISKINKNPLLESQMEALIVALELIWRIAKIKFIEERADSSERSGGVRYEKSLIFTKNIDLLDLLIDDKMIDVFLAWTFEKNNDEIDQVTQNKIIKFFTIISEEAIYRIDTPKGQINFKQNELYKEITSNGSVNIKSEKEARGSFRILKSLLKNDLNYLLKETTTDVLPKIDIDEIKQYQTRASTYLDLINYKVEFIEENDIKDENGKAKDISLVSEFPSKPYNRILYGAPGTGKSYKFYKELEGYPLEQIERVTFYSDYTYGKFIGMFKPTSGADYTYQGGPFLRILKKALENPKFPYFLIVEEINRTDTASTFGDIFQLLDRNNDGKSSYEIDISEDMKSYFDKADLLKNNKLYIPSNLYIWATMNSADQGVYPLDSAFKRRWSMEYVDINNGKEKRESLVIKFTTYKPIHWNTLREKLNDMMDSKGIREDKQLGVFFLKKGEDEKGEFNEEGFKNKLLMYLSEDVFRHQKREVFKKNTYGKILADFTEGKDIFISGEKEFDELNSLFQKV